MSAFTTAASCRPLCQGSSGSTKVSNWQNPNEEVLNLGWLMTFCPHFANLSFRSRVGSNGGAPFRVIYSETWQGKAYAMDACRLTKHGLFKSICRT
ncbi:unnamed protein product [Victoria cruziana]